MTAKYEVSKEGKEERIQPAFRPVFTNARITVMKAKTLKKPNAKKRMDLDWTEHEERETIRTTEREELAVYDSSSTGSSGKSI